MSNEKLFKIAESSIKTATNIAISNGMKFTVQIIPLQTNEGEFLSSDEALRFTETYVNDKMKYEPIKPRALEGMKKKWEQTHGTDEPFVPKPHPSELLVVLIAPCNDCIHLFYSVPTNMEYKVPPLHSSSKREHDNRVVHYSCITPPTYSTVFKYRDELSTQILNDLKVQKIYVDDESDDEGTVYCLNDYAE